jgi:hypothetical protein
MKNYALSLIYPELRLRSFDLTRIQYQEFKHRNAYPP